MGNYSSFISKLRRIFGRLMSKIDNAGGGSKHDLGQVGPGQTGAGDTGHGGHGHGGVGHGGVGHGH